MKNVLKNKLISIIISMLPEILASVSTEMASALTNGVLILEEKAKQTPNKWDDMIVDFLKAVLNME